MDQRLHKEKKIKIVYVCLSVCLLSSVIVRCINYYEL